MRQVFMHGFAIVVGLVPVSLFAQNIADYRAIPEPFLFLLREPEIQKELELTDQQQAKLIKLNESFDKRLLALRNTDPNDAKQQMARIMTTSRQKVKQLFSAKQKLRLQQITNQIQGISFVLNPVASDRLRLDEQQRKEIEAVVQKAKDDIQNLKRQVANEKLSNQEAQRKSVQVGKDEQLAVLDKLSNDQRKTLVGMIGKQMDLTRLGKVSFKAPELSKTGEWINSQGIQMSDLRGKVIALHFWAFG